MSDLTLHNNENYTKISLIHRANTTEPKWWQDCVVYEFAFGASQSALSQISSFSHDLVRLGVNAVLVRPSKVDFVSESKVIVDFISAFHKVGLKVFIQLAGSNADKTKTSFTTPFIDLESDPETVLERAKIAIDSGADAIDLGFILDQQLTPDKTVNNAAFVKLVADINHYISQSNSQTILAATASNLHYDKIVAELDEHSIEHLHSDSLAFAQFNKESFIQHIKSSYKTDSRQYGYGVWRYELDSATNKSYIPQYAWSYSAHDLPRRLNAIHLLVLGLPGAFYLQFLTEFGLQTPTDDLDKNFLQVEQLLHEQRQSEYSLYKTYKNALRTRTTHNMGKGNLASISGTSWANEQTLVAVCEKVYIVTNMSDEAIVVPPEYRLLLSSDCEVEAKFIDPIVDQDYQGTVLPPETTAWFMTKDTKNTDSQMPVNYSGVL